MKEELEEKGFTIRNVTSIRSWEIKEPLPLFFVHQEPGDNNKEIYKLKCMKCAENHPTNICNKAKDTPTKCTLCDGPHPASYKGCSVYRDLQKARGSQTSEIPLTKGISLNQVDVDSSLDLSSDHSPVILMLRKSTVNYPLFVRNKIAGKRNARKKWQNCRHPEDKRKLNKLSTELKKLLHKIKNDSIREYIENFSPYQEVLVILLASHENPIGVSRLLQEALNKTAEWAKKWKIKINASISVHTIFTTRHVMCPEVKLNNENLKTKDSVRYLGLHLDRRLTWKKHIKTKRKQLDLKMKSMYWILGHKSPLTLYNKLLLISQYGHMEYNYGVVPKKAT
ncbi:RNA-directed DNA polymerase from mobile element jockey [Habropoda laboriosa]|uniref:RNA-directed DNA polymerase from mobile element jockey n=1 Tax=Habropoda laboriosa TaxID=597456 RepID=A0A0L7R6K0_9HYME|nr:RNA-directed DNA polymerase from mobile element jockey [Habropoda laboriosa]